jgi:hypothetical protein
MEKYTPLNCEETKPVSNNKKKYSFVLGLVLVVSVIAVGVIFLSSPNSQPAQEFIQLNGDIVDGKFFDKNTELVSYAYPVYRYHQVNSDGSGWRFFYTFSSSVRGWTYDQKAFLAYSTSVSGSIPIYIHYKYLSDGGLTFAYTTYSTSPYGYTLSSVAFWGFYHHASNTKPVYQYYAYNADRTVRYFYTDTYTSYSGWYYEYIAFYVPIS